MFPIFFENLKKGNIDGEGGGLRQAGNFDGITDFSSQLKVLGPPLYGHLQGSLLN
jgi:hypothetical protein